MRLTSSKLRYLLTIDALEEEEPDGVYAVQVAIQLGVARASVCRMIAAFEQDGLLYHQGRAVQLSEKGKRVVSQYRVNYEKIYPLFSELVNLSQFEAQECAMALVTSLSQQPMEKLCRQLDKIISSKVTMK